jgi:hypothetical protein
MKVVPADSEGAAAVHDGVAATKGRWHR